MLLGTPLVLWFGSEVVSFLCCCHRLVDFHEDTFWGVGIYYAYIISEMNLVRYFQLMETLTFSLLFTWLVPTFGGSQRASERDSFVSMHFILGIYEDS